MKRLVFAVLFAAAALVSSDVCAQWMFDSSTQQQNTANIGRAAVPASPATGPIAPYSTAGQQPAPTVADTPGATSEWDTSGVIGRRDRDAGWRHEERMTGIESYFQGLRDGIDAARPWHWGPPPPVPFPPVYAPAGPGTPAKKPHH